MLAPVAAMAAIAALAQPGAQIAILDVVVNGVSYGTALVELLPDGDVLVPRDALIAAGLEHVLPPGVAEESVSLAALAPSLTFFVQEEDVSLQVRVEADRLGSSLVDLAREREAPQLVRASSAFLNYRIDYSRTLTGAAEEALTAPFELGVNAGPLFAQADFVLTDNAVQRRVDRARISLLWDQPELSRRWVAGDAFAATGRLGGAVALAGLSVESNFSLRPELVRIPGAAFDLELDVPTELEIRVNGATMQYIQLPPGRVRLENLQLPGGSAEIELILRDALGREQRLDAVAFGSSRLLRGGTHEYSYAAGAERLERTGIGFDYGDAVAAGFHRYGVNSSLTLGGRAEGARDFVSAGPSIALLLGSLGEAEIGYGFSRARDMQGQAAYLDYRFVRRGVYAVLGGDWTSAGYTTISQRDRPAREQYGARATLGTSLGRLGNVSADFLGRRVDGEWSTLLGGRIHANVSRALAFDLAVARGTGDREGFEMSATVAVIPGRYTSVRATVDRTANVWGERLSVSRSTPVGTGFSYRGDVVRRELDPESQTQGTAAVSYRGRYAEAEVGFRYVNDRPAASARLAGALTFIGGGLYVSRPITQGFALVSVAGLPGIEVRYRNERVGRTSGAGRLFLPELIPYSENRIELVPRDLPLEIEIPEPRQIIATPFRGGGVVEFPVKRFQSFVGKVFLLADYDDPRISLPAGVAKPAEFGELALAVLGEETPRVSTIGRGGLIYLENLPPGDHAATITLRGRICAFTLRVPESDQVQVDLGETVCKFPDP